MGVFSLEFAKYLTYLANTLGIVWTSEQVQRCWTDTQNKHCWQTVCKGILFLNCSTAPVPEHLYCSSHQRHPYSGMWILLWTCRVCEKFSLEYGYTYFSYLITVPWWTTPLLSRVIFAVLLQSLQRICPGIRAHLLPPPIHPPAPLSPLTTSVPTPESGRF